MINWTLYDEKFEVAIDSGSYIGELMNMDAVAEELIKTFPKWNPRSILQVTRGKIKTLKNTNIYRVELWKPVVGSGIQTNPLGHIFVNAVHDFDNCPACNAVE